MNSLALCLFVIVGISGALSEHCQRDSRFDIALLSVQWAPTACANKKCVKYGNEFTIHGMWPNYYDNSYPQFCCYEPYLNKKDLQPIKHELEKYWRSLYDDDSWSFWIHEWKKHGTCAEKSSALKGSFNYFNQTLELFKKLDLPSWLSTAGIEPKESGFALESVREAVRKGFGKRPQISCSGSISGLPLLSEIRLCYNPQTLAPMDCPVESRTCRSKTGKLLIIPA